MLNVSWTVASAGPDLGPLSASPVAQAWLRTFLASSTDQRQRMVQQVQSIGVLQQYVGVVQQVAGSCSSY